MAWQAAQGCTGGTREPAWAQGAPVISAVANNVTMGTGWVRVYVSIPLPRLRSPRLSPRLKLAPEQALPGC